jgi:hypothetical protein
MTYREWDKLTQSNLRWNRKLNWMKRMISSMLDSAVYAAVLAIALVLIFTSIGGFNIIVP